MMLSAARTLPRPKTVTSYLEPTTALAGLCGFGELPER